FRRRLAGGLCRCLRASVWLGEGQKGDADRSQKNEGLHGFHFNSCSRFCMSFFKTSLSSLLEALSVFSAGALAALDAPKDSARPAPSHSPSSCFFICTPTLSSICWPLTASLTRSAEMSATV